MEKEKNSKRKGIVYFIIGLLFVVAWLVGAVVFAKTERAEAAETSEKCLTVDVEGTLIQVPTDGREYYMILYEEYCVDVIISDVPFVMTGEKNGERYAAYFCTNRGTGITVYEIRKSEKTLGYRSDYYDPEGKTYRSFHFLDYISSHDTVNENTGDVVFSAKVPTNYSIDAPYTNFQKVVMRYGYEVNKLNDFYQDWMLNTEWKYYGHLNNREAGLDISYSITPTYLVQLPTVDYVLSVLSANDIDLSVDGDLSAFEMYRLFRCLPDVIRGWYNDKNAPYLEYEYDYIFELTPDANGNFVYGLTLMDIETLLKYCNADVLEKFKGYSETFRAIYMTFVHIECVTSVVETERTGSIMYGKITTNRFGRGVFETCVEVIPEIDYGTMDSEEMDRVIEDATKEAQDKYIEDLKGKVERLESELNVSTGTLGSFDAMYEGDNFWTAVKSAGNGLLGMLSTLAFIPQAFGSIFTFLPVEMQNYAGYVMLISLIVIIWRLFKGK